MNASWASTNGSWAPGWSAIRELSEWCGFAKRALGGPADAACPAGVDWTSGFGRLWGSETAFDYLRQICSAPRVWSFRSTASSLRFAH